MGIGLSIALYNYYCLGRMLLGKQSESVIPVIGGVLGSVGLLLLNSGISKWWSIAPLFLDLYCVPYVALAFLEVRKAPKEV
ncbi:MAG: hypothetical protein ACAH95_02825 [Fimbriimonas sp.]